MHLWFRQGQKISRIVKTDHGLTVTLSQIILSVRAVKKTLDEHVYTIWTEVHNLGGEPFFLYIKYASEMVASVKVARPDDHLYPCTNLLTDSTTYPVGNMRHMKSRTLSGYKMNHDEP